MPSDVHVGGRRIPDEVVQVDDDQLERLDAVLRHVAPVIRQVTSCQDASEDHGVKRLDEPTQDCRETREGFDLGDPDLDLGILDELGRSVGRNEPEAQCVQRCDQVHEPGCVRH